MRIDQLEAIRAMDIDRVMPIYAPDIVSFDIEPPLYVGAEPFLSYEIRRLVLTVDSSRSEPATASAVSAAKAIVSRSGAWNDRAA